MAVRWLGLLGALSMTGCALVNAASGGNQGGDAPLPDGPRIDAPSIVDAAPDGPQPDAVPCASPYNGVLATWDLTGQLGSQVSTDAASTAPGVTAGSISRAASLVPTNGTDSISSTNWATTAQLDGTKYYTFSITPPAGCALQVTSLAIDARSSFTGPTLAAVASSADGFTQTAAVSTTVPGTVNLPVSGVSATLELRIYGFAASAVGGTMRVELTLSVTGALQ